MARTTRSTAKRAGDGSAAAAAASTPRLDPMSPEKGGEVPSNDRPEKEQKTLDVGAKDEKITGPWVAPDGDAGGGIGDVGGTAAAQAAGTSAAKPASPESSPQRQIATQERNGESPVQAPATPSPSTRKKRTYFDVDFNEKEEAKAMGARWDGDMKQWYAASDTVAQRLAARFTAAPPAGARKFFSVRFSDKDRAKLMGGRWDAKMKLWYAPTEAVAENMAAVWQAVNASPVPLLAAGEDRCFGGAHTLYIDLLPHSSHGKTLQRLLPAAEFARLKSHVLARARTECECCGAAASVCHPRFHYNHHRLVQKLRRLMALCSECKRSTHLGMAAINGEKEPALEHLRRVKHLDASAVMDEEAEAWRAHYARDSFSWQIDLSLLSAAGLHPVLPSDNAADAALELS